MDLFSIYFSRNLKVIIAERKGKLPVRILATALKNLESLGYTFSTKLIDVLRTWERSGFVSWFERLMGELQQMKEIDLQETIMYPRFPKQKMNIQESQLYLNVLMHSWRQQFPEHENEQEQRILWLDKLRLRVIQLGSEADFYQVGINLLATKAVLKPVARDQLIWFATEYEGWSAYEPEPGQIPVRENAAVYCAALLKVGRASLEQFQRHLQTATDILCLAVACSDGDVTLKENTRFRSFKRSERRVILALLEASSDPLEDLFRYKGRWLRLAERLHPGEYQHRYPRAVAALNQLRRGERPLTFHGRVERAFEQKDNQLILETLTERPIELVGQLDRMIRSGVPVQHVIGKLEVVEEMVSTRALLRLLAHFSTRNEFQARRSFFPKGNTANLYVSTKPLQPISLEDIHTVISAVEHILLKRFAGLPPLGNVYIDERLQDFTVPWRKRRASESIRALSCASWLSLPTGDTVRFFVWWKEGMMGDKPTGRVDADLSSVLYDPMWRYMDQTSCTYRQADEYQAAQSGNMVNAPDGVAKYTDVHLPSVSRSGARYMVIMVNAFTADAFKDLPECYAGWIMRQAPQSDEMFEPSTVQERMELTTESRICIPAVIDIHERRILWCDLGLKRHPKSQHPEENNKADLAWIARAMTELKRPDLYTLFMLHAKARGTLVETLGMANLVFTAELESNRVAEVAEYLTEGPPVDRTVITPLEQDYITKHFL
ncbi:cytoplasmic protein [Paenibacillus sp. F6_3S_P_1C]|uniref:Cytoplasmic protein n=1 Tax=Paenibacillus vandeheii TaxID=3035917 RepID=A0ABT8JE63_9BACL|nr:cytoplasmic protein [Paenibacillus vandeheii]MDN4603381.1 cytoplasmic protein [Paenibacillus vandeheii]